jgi:hypothetical protein
MSAGSLYVLTAPRRQPGGLATTNEARANKVVVKRVRACIVIFVIDSCSRALGGIG